MTQPNLAVPNEILAVTLVRRYGRMIAALGAVGLAAGVVVAFLTPRQYVTAAAFIPESQESSTSSLALAASQFGFQLPSANNTWGTALYVDLLNSRMLLDSVALDTFTVAEEGGRRIAMMDLLDTPNLPVPRRTEAAVRLLRKLVSATEDKRLNAVRLTVSTRWPSVSFAIANNLLSGVNRFNVETRRTQATEERKFVEGRVTDAETEVSAAEGRLQTFMQQNRIANSPELTFQQDRLQRDVTLRQSVLTSLLQKREEARIKEVRDVPVITIFETPQLAVTGEGRRSIMKGGLGAFAGAGLAILIAFIMEAMAEARRESPEAVGGVFGVVRALLRFRAGA